jgi:hypothetical protein
VFIFKATKEEIKKADIKALEAYRKFSPETSRAVDVELQRRRLAVKLHCARALLGIFNRKGEKHFF